MRNRNNLWQENKATETSMLGGGLGAAAGFAAGVFGKLFLGHGAHRGVTRHILQCTVVGKIAGMGIGYASVTIPGFFAEQMIRRQLSKNMESDHNEQSVHQRR